MFAAKAGAKQVIGIDMSNILDTAQKIIDANGFTDSRLFDLDFANVSQRSLFSRASLRTSSSP